MEQRPVRVVRDEDLQDADPTPGMRRRRAVEAPGLWAGLVHTEPRAASGWHHHGEHETSLFVVRGRMRLEFGPGGREVVEAGPGEFLHVPAGTVHRESNPDSGTATAVIARAGVPHGVRNDSGDELVLLVTMAPRPS